MTHHWWVCVSVRCITAGKRCIRSSRRQLRVEIGTGMTGAKYKERLLSIVHCMQMGETGAPVHSFDRSAYPYRYISSSCPDLDFLSGNVLWYSTKATVGGLRREEAWGCEAVCLLWSYSDKESAEAAEITRLHGRNIEQFDTFIQWHLRIIHHI